MKKSKVLRKSKSNKFLVMYLQGQLAGMYREVRAMNVN
jgi:hypothetical protein